IPRDLWEYPFVMHDTILQPALEKGIYASFRQKEMSWRVSSIGSKLITTTDLQLPNNSVLHVIDRLLDSTIPSILPDITNPFIKNETFLVYLDNVLSLPGK